ncbi:MAG: hypothetical protein NTV21_10445 [Planctomycetota bacterium]|nr:hypothetical protein [Planctomycetota bacterium]
MEAPTADERAECPERVALEHATRRWEAETGNAERLASRENGLLTILSALVGFGFFNYSDFEGIEPAWLPQFLRLIVTAALALILGAFVRIFLVARRRRDSKGAAGVHMYASGHLDWPTQASLQPNALASEEEAVRIAFARTSLAAASLHRRNVRRKENLDNGQRWLVGAVVVAASGFLCYTWFGRSGEAASASGEARQARSELSK